MLSEKKSPQYVYAYDPKIKRRVVHAIRGKYAISLVTGNKFIYNK